MATRPTLQWLQRVLMAALAMMLLASLFVRAEDVEDADDDDAFVPNDAAAGAGAAAAGRNSFSLTGDNPVKPRPALDLNTLKLIDLWFEALMVLAMAAYFVLFTFGKRTNRELARHWMRMTLPVWEANFAHVGSNEGHKLIRDGPRDYIFYASGRNYVKHVYGFVRLVSRQDPIQWLIDYAQKKDLYDKVTLKVTFDDKVADPFVLSILPFRTNNKIVKSRWDLNNFTKPRDLPGMPKDEYQLATDAPEFSNALWKNEKIRAMLFKSLGLSATGEGTPAKYPMIDEIIFSDLPKTKPETMEALQVPRTLTVVFRLPNVVKPTDEDVRTITELTEFVMELIDLVGEHGSFSNEGKAKVNKLRLGAVDTINKAQEEARKEELAKKKAAEKKARDEQVAKLSPEEQRKYEEKEKKRELKKSQSKLAKRGKMRG
ncbi:hypothetical protein BC831DRAFT_516334 [Entophlyctis helioformis]|nr:hypothetical protein BC831DRAFT_516334 [Entophlyctis helioformis]